VGVFGQQPFDQATAMRRIQQPHHHAPPKHSQEQ